MKIEPKAPEPRAQEPNAQDYFAGLYQGSNDPGCFASDGTSGVSVR